METSSLERIYAASRRAMGKTAWRALAGGRPHASEVPGLVDGEQPYLADLARLEWAMEQARCSVCEVPARGPLRPVPGLEIVQVAWQGLPGLIGGRDVLPEAGDELVLVLPQFDGGVRCRAADADDLLALKMASEGLDPLEVARQEDAPAGALWEVLYRARARGLLAGTLPGPGPLLVRHPRDFPRPEPGDDDSSKTPQQAYAAGTFTLQWHITQRCDLNCRHCYDRSERADVDLDTGLRVIDETAAFCRGRGVEGQISFIGGNPLLHPHFMDFYRAARRADLDAAVLGNPCSGSRLDQMAALGGPVFFQVSLEGLEEHNDHIRGPGHFQRTLAFLDLLQERGVPAHVMLTLTRANMDQVLPLARLLQGRADSVTFNRLALMGQGASLSCADPAAFWVFLEDYLRAARDMSHLRLKDNLFNLLLHQHGEPLAGGCTGHGCGAAFNFLALLSDGRAHACRKLDSPVGDMHESGLAAVYDGEAAAAWRRGSLACRGCAVRAVCGGCLAVAAGMGLDPLRERDPYCWLER